ncbi:hypothetical protein GJ496_011258 [Pomphorhynchus laevis]|nr:hypothetical protein GJ496_011258 [Pomphorhynchus laevis]
MRSCSWFLTFNLYRNTKQCILNRYTSNDQNDNADLFGDTDNSAYSEDNEYVAKHNDNLKGSNSIEHVNWLKQSLIPNFVNQLYDKYKNTIHEDRKAQNLENMCTFENETVVKITEDELKVGAVNNIQTYSQSKFKSFQNDGVYRTQTIVYNGTHRIIKLEITSCCEGYFYSEDERKCSEIIQTDLNKLLKSHNATQFLDYFANNDNPINKTLFIYPSTNDDEKINETFVQSSTINDIVRIEHSIVDNQLIGNRNNSILISSNLDKDDNRVYYANCVPLIAINNYTLNNSIVHTAKTNFQLSTPDISDYIKSNPNLSYVSSLLIQSENKNSGVQYSANLNNVVSTFFIPTNDAIDKVIDSWNEFKDDNDRIEFMCHYLQIRDKAICLNDNTESSMCIEKKVDQEGDEAFYFKGYRISNTEKNIVTKNGIVHLVDEIEKLPTNVRSILSYLKTDGNNSAFYKAFVNSNITKNVPKGSFISVLLPPSISSKTVYTNEEIKRHVLIAYPPNSTNKSLIPEFTTITADNAYNPRKMYANCVPIDLQNSVTLWDGDIFPATSQIPASFGNISEALKSTGKHQLFKILYDAYVKYNTSDHASTVIAVDDKAFKNISELMKFITTKGSDEEYVLRDDIDKYQLTSAMNRFIVFGKNCINPFDEESFSLNSLSHDLYEVHTLPNVAKIYIGQAEVTHPNLVSINGIVHCVDRYPTAVMQSDFNQILSKYTTNMRPIQKWESGTRRYRYSVLYNRRYYQSDTRRYGNRTSFNREDDISGEYNREYYDFIERRIATDLRSHLFIDESVLHTIKTDITTKDSRVFCNSYSRKEQRRTNPQNVKYIKTLSSGFSKSIALSLEIGKCDVLFNQDDPFTIHSNDDGLIELKNQIRNRVVSFVKY